MTLLECFEAYNDEQIHNLINGMIVEIKYKDGSSQTGLVTNFVKAAVADDVDRSIVGIVLDDRDYIAVSSNIIEDIFILNR